MIIDDNEVKRALKIFREDDNSLFEVRLIPTYHSNKGNIWSGYFISPDVMLKELHSFYENKYYNGHRTNSENVNAYFTLNVIDPNCYRRIQHDKFVLGTDSTSDENILRRRWLFLDFDPERLSGTSSTNEQMEKAKAKAIQVFKYLQAQGFGMPITAISGNGYHFHWKIDIDNSEESKDIIANFYQALNDFFSDSEIKIDSGNFNASRICKLYGTMAQKGYASADAPHRMSKILSVPKNLETLNPAYIKKIADIFINDKKDEQDNKYSGYRSDKYQDKFDLGEWLTKYGLGYRTESYKDGVKYILDECPFNPEHKNKDACLFVRANGAIGFKCLHDHCINKTWKDVRLKYEPDAYDVKPYKANFNQRNRNTEVKPLSEAKLITEKNGNPVWYSMKQIDALPTEDDCFVRSGLSEFDNHFCGLRKRGTTILSGYSGGSKSTLLSQICLNAIEDGNNVGCFSGELYAKDFARWFHLQAAGKMYAERTDYQGYCNVSNFNIEHIDDWCEGKFWLYNNSYGFKYDDILETIKQKIDEDKLDLVCIDNLMILDTSSLGFKDLDQQKVFAQSIHNLAQEKNVHVIVVCHPRKPSGLLGMYDVLGSSNIVNLFDNIVFVYRVTQEFKNFYQQYYGMEFSGDGTNAYHVAKARFGSVNDDYYDLFYEPETKRLKNAPAEYIHYGWESALDVFT